MFIISVLFYLLAGTMDSSFLTGIHVLMALWVLLRTAKFMIQFGIPNHPARFTCYVVILSASFYLIGQAGVDLGLLPPWQWMKWRSLPLIAGFLCLLLQMVMATANLSNVYQKIISRIPLMGALLCFAFFSEFAEVFSLVFLLSGALFLFVVGTDARYQRRVVFKMLFFSGVWLGFRSIGFYWAYILAELFIIFSLFYFFLFEESIAIKAMIENLYEEAEGVSV